MPMASLGAGQYAQVKAQLAGYRLDWVAQYIDGLQIGVSISASSLASA